jgi:hypothetical protein
VYAPQCSDVVRASGAEAFHSKDAGGTDAARWACT